MKARLTGLSLKVEGGQTITLDLAGDYREEYQALKDSDVEVVIKKYRQKRSMDANNLCWALCRDIAKAMPSPHTDAEIYRHAIRDVGEYEPLPIKAEAVDTFKRRWETKGVGWFVDVLDDSKLPGYKVVRAFYGSSSYDSKEMSRLLDYLVDEAQQMGIVIPTNKYDVEKAKSEWTI